MLRSNHFRENLIEAVRRRDVKYVVGILDPAIVNSFGGSGGIEEFTKMWKLTARQVNFGTSY